MNLHVPGQAEQNVELIRGENVVLLGEIVSDIAGWVDVWGVGRI